jgi:RND family efflux transporter MFP subunit
MKKLLAAIVLVLVAGGGVWTLTMRQPAPERGEAASVGDRVERSTPVVLGRVEQTPVRTRLEAVGTTRAARSVTLYPASTGEVVEVHFGANRKVRAGELLLTLDARDEKLALELAELRLADAERLLSRYTRAEGSGAFTPTQIDEARSAVIEARIARDRAEVALDDRTLEAPFSGVVGLSTIDPGDRVTPQTPITTLDDRGTLLVRFDVPETFLGRLRTGDQVQLAPWNDGGVSISAEIVDVDSRVDPLTRTFVARARLENPEDRWRPGMSFRVAMDLTGRAYAEVPELAVQWGGEGAYVWAVGDDGLARRVPASIVQRNEGVVLLDADLAAGSRVVVEGVQQVREGSRVQIVGTAGRLAGDPIEARVEATP